MSTKDEDGWMKMENNQKPDPDVLSETGNLPVVQQDRSIIAVSKNDREITVSREVKRPQSVLSSLASQLVRTAVRSALDWISERRNAQSNAPASENSLQTFRRGDRQRDQLGTRLNSRCRRSVRRKGVHLKRKRWMN